MIVPTSMTLHGRVFTVEVTKDPLAGKTGYRFRGVRGACYRTIRNAQNPDLMFLVNEKRGKVVEGFWVTDKGGVLKPVKVW